MIQIINKEDCCGCKGCQQICPVHAISMNIDDEGFWYPKVDTDKCTNCHLCEKVCPELTQCNASTDTAVYAAYRKDFNLRLKSQSGGIFSIIAEKILEDGGIVFGACFDHNWNVKHIPVTSINELQKLRGSKYVQSDIGDTYTQVQSLLKENKKVLFSGTPCQVQGLKKYLNKEYSNLYTIDLICHGVPSPMVWHKALEEHVGINNIKEYIQKDKERNNAIVYKLNNGKEKIEKYDDNLFIKGFNCNLYLRPSCYACSFKGIERCSDITIGDYWGIEKVNPEFYDQYGISAILIHSDKGQALLDSIKNDIEIYQSDVNDVIKENPCIYQSIDTNELRNEFFNKIKEKNIMQVLHDHYHIAFNKRIVEYLKSIKYSTKERLYKLIYKNGK